MKESLNRAPNSLSLSPLSPFGRAPEGGEFGPIERSDTEEKLLKILEIKKNKLPTKVIEF